MDNSMHSKGQMVDPRQMQMDGNVQHMEAMQRGMMEGIQRNGPGPQMAMNPEMTALEANFHQMQMQLPPPPQFQHQHPPQQMQHMGGDWAAEYAQQGPPPMAMQHPAEFERIFAEQQQQHAARAAAAHQWANEFHRMPPQPPMEAMPQGFDGAWAESGAPPMQQSMGEAWSEAGRADASLEAAWSEGGQQAQGEGESSAAPPSAALRATTGAVIKELQSAADPRFSQSEFLKFMQELNTGEKRVQGNVVVEGAAERGALDEAWDEAGPQDAAEVAWNEVKRPAEAAAAAMRQAWEESGDPSTAGMVAAVEAGARAAQAASSGPMSELESAWSEALNTEGEADLEKVWEKAFAAALAEGQGEDGFEEYWSGAADLSQANGLSRAADAAYEFAPNNQLANKSVDELHALGRQRFDEGRLSEAITAFEAIAQQDPDDSEAWRMLGQAFAEHDEDRKAIQCLERAVQADPYNLEALQALGVSYVNELDSYNALKNLKAWVQHNPKYQGLEIVEDEYSDGSLMDEVMQLMLQAAQWDPNDADAQVVMGVLYNVSRDFDSGIASFRRALVSKPNDYTLWNKVGATLANCGRSAEALPAYDRALDLKSRFARGWLNRGIALANQSQYMESGKCYLQALSLNPDANHIWNYLRIALSCAERADLVQHADARDLAWFRREFGLLE